MRINSSFNDLAKAELCLAINVSKSSKLQELNLQIYTQYERTRLWPMLILVTTA